jgi:type VI protein secretion system component Hcp
LDSPFQSEISSGSDSEEVDDNHDVEGNNWEVMQEQVTVDTESEDDNIKKRGNGNGNVGNVVLSLPITFYAPVRSLFNQLKRILVYL